MDETIASPDVLLNDPESMEFYVLRDEQIVICKRRQDLPYYKNRQTYLSSGRFSPKHKKVVFWPDPVNPQRAIQLLKEGLHIDDTFTYSISGASTRIGKATKPVGPLDRLSSSRKMTAQSLLNQGKMKIQGADNSQPKDLPKDSD